MIEFGHDTSHDTIKIAGFVDPRSFLTEAPGEFFMNTRPRGLPGPFGDRYRDLQARGFPQTNFPSRSANFSIS